MTLIPTNIQTQLDSIKSSKTDIRNAITAKGGTISSSDILSDYDDCIGTITGGELQTKTLTANASTPTEVTITPDTGYYGLGEVNVDMSYYEDKIDDILGNSTVLAGCDLKREVSNQGVYQMPSNNFSFSLPNDATSLGNYALYHAFIGSTGLTTADLSSLITISSATALNSAFSSCTNLTSIDLSNLETVSGNQTMSAIASSCSNLISVDLSSLVTVSGYRAFSYSFQTCRRLTSVNLSSLTTISANEAMYYTFQNCEGLTSIDLSSLTTISGTSGLSYTFYNCSNLTSVNLSNLTTISASAGLLGTFGNCISLSTLSFPALTSESFGNNTNQFNNMLSGVTGCTVHFPSNLQSVIGSWTSITNGFGGTNTVVSFDLPATT